MAAEATIITITMAIVVRAEGTAGTRAVEASGTDAGMASGTRATARAGRASAVRAIPGQRGTVGDTETLEGTVPAFSGVS